MSGNRFEFNLFPDYKILPDAGYNVLAYDLRDHGLSSAANGGVTTTGVSESRDVVGLLEYVRTRLETGKLATGLFSRCMGGSATLSAMMRFPSAFEGVCCLVSPQPVTPRIIVERRLAKLGLGDRLDDFDTYVRLRTSVGLDERIPQEWAKSVRVPTFLYQVRGDLLTNPGDIQAIFDNIPTADKKLHWIEGTTASFDGYLAFQRRPQPMLDWFTQYLR